MAFAIPYAALTLNWSSTIDRAMLRSVDVRVAYIFAPGLHTFWRSPVAGR